MNEKRMDDIINLLVAIAVNGFLLYSIYFVLKWIFT
jgi:hypothetical protein